MSINSLMENSYTGVALLKIKDDITFISKMFKFFTFALAAISSIIRIVKGEFIVINVILLASLVVCTALSYFIKEDRAKRKAIKLVGRGIKIVAHAPMLFITVMGLYTSSEDPTVISLLLLVLLILMWVLNLMFEIIEIYINARWDMLKEAVALDKEHIVNAVNPKNIITNVFHHGDDADKSTDTKENVHRRFLRRKKAKYDAEKEKAKVKKAEEKKRRKEEKKALKKK